MHPYIKKLIRQEANQRGTSYPIIVVKGNRKPHLTGKSYYWTTPSGKTIINHPNAYGWPTKYNHSTLRIEVGEKWLNRRGIVIKNSPIHANV